MESTLNLRIRELGLSLEFGANFEGVTAEWEIEDSGPILNSQCNK